MNIIITGATGFVGQNLQKYLNERQYEINVLSLRKKDWRQDFSAEADAIIHLAGKAHDTSNKVLESEYLKVNRDLTIELFELFLTSEVRDFFYFSSVKAVADTVRGVLTEEVSACPRTVYGKSKSEAERYILSKKIPVGKRVFIIRPCMIHGPGNKGNLNLLYNVVKRNIPWPLAAFRNQRSFLGIDNLNYLVRNILLKSDVESGVYNFSDDEPLSTNELVSLISKTLNKDSKMWEIPENVVQGIAKIGDLLSLPINSDRLKKLTESYVVSNMKIKKALDIDRLPLSTKDGLVRTIESFMH